MLNILVSGTGTTFNNGNMAMLLGVAKSLQERVQRVSLGVLLRRPERERERLNRYPYNIDCVQGTGSGYLEDGDTFRAIASISVSLIKCALWRLTRRDSILNTETLKWYLKADVVIDLGGDTLTDSTILMTLWNLYPILLALVLKKPVMIYAQTIGPFRSPLTRIATAFILNRVNLTTVRERITLSYLKELGVEDSRFRLTADAAFLLDPCSSDRIDEIFQREQVVLNSRPLIGVSVSRLVSRYAFPDVDSVEEKHVNFVETVAKVLDYLIDRLEAVVLFVPHVVGDGMVAEEVIDSMSHRDNARNLCTEEYSADELKGVIGRCDVFTGARMHSTIASTSMAVPTVALAYSEKAIGIIGMMLGMNDYVVDIRKCNREEFLKQMTEKIENAWLNRHEIKSELKQQVEHVKKQALLNTTLLIDLLQEPEKNATVS